MRNVLGLIEQRKKQGHKHRFLGSVILIVALAGVVNATAQPAPDTAPDSGTTPPPTATSLTEGTTPPAAEKTNTPAPPKFDLVDAAARYVALSKEANRMTFPNALALESIASCLTTTARLSSKQITEGVGAYATLSVANDPAFAASVRTAIGFLGREAALARLKENPASFLELISTSKDATKLASGAIVNSLARIEAAQVYLGEAAYSLQKEAWANAEQSTPDTLSGLRAAALEPSGLPPFSSTDLPAQPSDLPVNSRYVVAATYYLLDDPASAAELLDKPLGRMCMNRVQLNVRQCIAASKFPFEYAFCLSQHSFGETVTCVKDAVK